MANYPEKRDGEFIEHLPHEECGSSDGLAVYEKDDGTINGYCWACDTFVAHPYPEGREKMEAPRPQLHMDWRAEVEPLKAGPLPDRGLRDDTMSYFGAKVAYDQSDGRTISHHYYPITKGGVVSGYKQRRVKDKHFTSLGDCRGDTDLFGYAQARDAGGKKLFITEGELDAMALYQVLVDANAGTKWAHLKPSVVSLTKGAAGAAKEVGRCEHFISRFEEVILVFDNDEAGRAASASVASLFPHKVKIVTLSEKDACDMLKKKKTKALRDAVLFQGEQHKPDGLKCIADLKDAMLKPVQWGLSWPWPKVTQDTYGIRRGELYIFGAGSGCGKTEAFKEIIQHVVHEHHNPVGLFFLEEPAARTAKAIAGKFANQRFHIPDAGWKQEQLEEQYAIMAEENLIHIYDSFGVKKWDSIKEKIRYMVVVLGVKDIFLDHLTALTADEPDERRALDTMLAEMSSMAEDLNFTFYAISHLTRPGQGRKSHEEGGRVRQADYRGSGSIAFWAHYMFALERNTQDDDFDKRNQVVFRCLKDRMSGNATGSTTVMKFDHDTGRLLEAAHNLEGLAY